MRVLIVEGELKLADLVRRGLIGDGMTPDVALRGEDALWMAAATEYDAIILDAMLPDIDGLETCHRLRAAGIWSPVLMLSARDAVEDRVAGLNGGADDYLTKPFSFAELGARLRALTRRGPSRTAPSLTVGPLELDPASRRVRRGTVDIALSAKEYALLEAFMRRPGWVLDRPQLLALAWEGESESASNLVDVYVRYLREKIDRPFNVQSIETVRGAGYRLRDDGGRPAT
jgi:two-component system OmpR family response regulator